MTVIKKYEVLLRRAAQEALNNLPTKDFRMVGDTVVTLRDDPRPVVHRLADSGLWRLRVGRYRLVCAIDDDSGILTILSVALSMK
ncbi:MAG: type II toxin-antitoxin system RelE/ParE family toxin [Dehalococcoidia bacterium]|nr:MAG: type II toxin-antitoxin system RelE/ParE family toxin [Dehalococcoidia bacterium]